jgi:hypothetical protein
MSWHSPGYDVGIPYNGFQGIAPLYSVYPEEIMRVEQNP